MRGLAGLLVFAALALAGCGGSSEPQPAVSTTESGKLTIRIVGVGGPAGQKSTPLRGTVLVSGDQGKDWRVRVTDAKAGASINVPTGDFLVSAKVRGASCDQEYVTISAANADATTTRTCSLK